MKFEQLRKRVLLEIGIIVAIVAVLAGVVYGLGTIEDEYTEKEDTAKKEVDAIDTEMNGVRTKYESIMGNVDVYHKIQDKQSKGDLVIQRQAMLDKFNEFQGRYMLNNLSLNMSAPQDMTDAKYKRKTSSVNYREVSVTFDTVSDENVYDLINAIQHELPGVAKVVKLSMTKSGPLTDGVIDEISHKGTSALVKTDMKFIWYGINPIDSGDKNANAIKK